MTVQAGTVYAIAIEGTTLVKIGMTSLSPEKRLQQLQIGLPYRLKLLKVYACANPKIIERRMHGLLKARWHAGEWFDCDIQEIDAVFEAANTDPVPKRPEDTPETLGERVLMWRKRRKTTQHDLAAKMEIHPMSLSKIERGAVKAIEPDTLCKLAKALSVKTDYLLGLVGEEDAEAEYDLQGVGA